MFVLVYKYFSIKKRERKKKNEKHVELCFAAARSVARRKRNATIGYKHARRLSLII